MKLRKIVAAVSCFALVLAMMTGFTAMAATGNTSYYGTPTITLTHTGYNSSGYANITVSYSGFENFVEFDTDEYENDGTMTATGISAMSANFTATNATYQGGTKKLCAVSTKASGVQSCNNAATDPSLYITSTSGDMAVIRYAITDPTQDTTITLTDAVFEVIKNEADAEVPEYYAKWVFEDITVVPCTIAGTPAVTEYNVTYATATNGTVTGAATTTDGKVNVTVTPNAGYEVASLTVGGVAQNIANIKNGGTVELTLEADAEIAATFVKVAPWDVTYTAATNGTVTGAAKTDADGKVAVTVTPAKGYKVASVTVDGVAQNISALDAKVGGTLNLTLTKDATIAATFAEIELAVVTYANVYNDADGVAVFGKYEGTATAAGIYLAKGGAAVTHANAADGKYANAKAAADKYFGVMWTGLEAGTYAANAYADAANGAVVNFTVAE